MRQIVLDTETTGLSTSKGHRVIEIGCLEILNRRFTGNEYHCFLDPERDIDEAAQLVHGISRSDLDGQPRFKDIADEFLDFIRGSQLLIHNAEFDVGFLNHELKLMDHPEPFIKDYAEIIDTLTLARELHPGQRNSLDALCKRYSVDASKRDVHGALIDAELLAKVYLAMSGGQTALILDNKKETIGNNNDENSLSKRDFELVVFPVSDAEITQHEAILNKIEEIAEPIYRKK